MVSEKRGQVSTETLMFFGDLELKYRKKWTMGQRRIKPLIK